MRTKKPEQAERMLDAAARLFGTHLYHQVRMEDVASVAGVGKGTLYRYFDDKDELYLALLERARDQLDERIRLGVESAQQPIQKLEALASAVLEFFTEQPHVFELILRGDAERGSRTPWQKLRTGAIQLVLDLFRLAQERGDFTVADPQTAALILLGGLRALVRFGPKPHPPDLAARYVRSVLFGAAKMGR